MSSHALVALLRCPVCDTAVRLSEDLASCGAHSFPVRAGVPRLLPADLMEVYQGSVDRSVRARTYRSFGFEWTSFSQQLDSYAENFQWYVEPLGNADLAGCRVLDAGCGMGRHTFHLLKAGAEVVALDASPAVEVAAANCPNDRALFVQGDLLRLPLPSGAFDLVCCLGVLHHLDDTLGGLRALVQAARPGGRVLIFLYHDGGASAVRRALLSVVRLTRGITTRMPFPLLRGLTLGLATLIWLFWVGPLKLMSGRRGWQARFADVPLGQYVHYPFRVLWNDQFDRFSAPLEKRYSKAEVEELMTASGLVDLVVLPGYGWRAAGRRPDA